MKIQWDSNIDYQKEAVNSVIDLFRGQISMLQYFTVSSHVSLIKDAGIGNKIVISNEDILENLRKVQFYNKLTHNNSLNSLDFDIRMAKGTGKTYVYLKTIFELNKQYGFTKFIIVSYDETQTYYVKRFIDETKNHFKNIFDSVIFDYFIYDSHDLQNVRNYAVNSNIQIMIININSFRSKNSIIYRKHDKLMGIKPIELISETNPIVIVDDSEKVLRGKGKQVIGYLNPLFSLRYSSKLFDSQNLIYNFDLDEAYEFFRLNYFDYIQKEINKR